MTRTACCKVWGSGAISAGRVADVPNLTLKHTSCVTSGKLHTFSEPPFSDPPTVSQVLCSTGFGLGPFNPHKPTV